MQGRVAIVGGGIGGLSTALSLLHHGILGTVAFLVIGAAALLYQMRDVGQTITSIDRSAYSY